ncbi:MAG: N-6 DNA methylase [Nocardioidaceae bacterium]
MITGELKSKIDRIWDAFWSGGISNPLEVIEQITYLLFIRRLDDLQIAKENRANRLKEPIEDPLFKPGQDDLRWSRFKSMDPAVMFKVIGEQVFPFLRELGGDGSTYSGHMKDARFTVPTPQLLSRVVDMLDDVPMNERDTNGDLYEYMLSKIASAGTNGQFRTPRHIIALMVAMTAPRPKDEICDPACGTAGFLVAASEFLRREHPTVLTDAKQREHLVGVGIANKLNLIRKLGNLAVHETRPIPPRAAQDVLRELHHIIVWTAFRYSTRPQDVPTGAHFDPALAGRSTPLSRDDVVRLAEKFRKQDEVHQRALADKDNLAAAKDAEIAELRRQIAAAQAANARTDDHDYAEAETRDRFIDVCSRRRAGRSTRAGTASTRSSACRTPSGRASPTMSYGATTACRSRWWRPSAPRRIRRSGNSRPSCTPTVWSR